MSTQTLAAIQAKRLAFLKASRPFDIPTEKPLVTVEAVEGDVRGGLPESPTEEYLANITVLWQDSEKYVAPAREKLSRGENSEATPDWGVVLHELFIAWIVNLGKDPLVGEAREAAKAGDTKGAAILLEQSQELIYKAAENLGLEWIPFIDLALTAFDPEVEEEKQESGPFGGVFINRGEFPFMILAFKGTTYQKEVNTDKGYYTAQPREGVLYDERVHRGMYQGMFERFPGYENIGDAFDIIFENLELVAKDIQSTKQVPVPLYVTGHSLGAGYGGLAYIQLTSRLATEATSYKLLDLHIYGAPRTGLNPLAVKMKKVLEDTKRHLWRITRVNDIVPTIPSLVPVDGKIVTYKHFDGGYRLTPNGTAPFVNACKSEIDGTIYNDPLPTLELHGPDVYYVAIRKVLDSAAAA